VHLSSVFLFFFQVISRAITEFIKNGVRWSKTRLWKDHHP